MMRKGSDAKAALMIANRLQSSGKYKVTNYKDIKNTVKSQRKGSWLDFVKAHSNMRTAKGLLDLKAISKLWKAKGSKALEDEKTKCDCTQMGLYDPAPRKPKREVILKIEGFESKYVSSDKWDKYPMKLIIERDTDKIRGNDMTYITLDRGYPNSKTISRVLSYGHLTQFTTFKTYRQQVEKGYQIDLKIHTNRFQNNVDLVISFVPQGKNIFAVYFYENNEREVAYFETDEEGYLQIEKLKNKHAELFYDAAPRRQHGVTRPPKRWFYAMLKGIKERSDVRDPGAIVGNIWKKLTPQKKASIKAREASGKHFSYDLPLPEDKPTRGTGTLRMVKPFKLAEVQVNLSIKDYLSALKSGLFSKMKRNDGTTALVARCKSENKNCNIFVDKVT